MKVEVTIDETGGQNQVVDARCTGTLFRGFEILLQGRQPIDATAITQRICGVCPISHAQASVLALENIAGPDYQPWGPISFNPTSFIFTFWRRSTMSKDRPPLPGPRPGWMTGWTARP